MTPPLLRHNTYDYRSNLRRMIHETLSISVEGASGRSPYRLSSSHSYPVRFVRRSSAWRWTHPRPQLHTSCHRFDICARLGLYGPGSQLHALPGHHWVVYVYPRFRHCSAGGCLVQRGIRTAAALRLHSGCVCVDAFDGCIVRGCMIHRLTFMLTALAIGPKISKQCSLPGS